MSRWLEGVDDEAEGRRRRRRKGARPRPEPPADDPDGLPVAVWVPILCPVCGSRRHRCEGTHGRVRYHDCTDCGARFKSLEIPPGGKQA